MPHEPYRSEKFYGGTLLIAYGVPLSVTWLALGADALADTDRQIFLLAAYSELTTLVAPPIVHWAHGEAGLGFRALAGNLVLSGLGFYFGDCETTTACASPFLGVAIGQTLWAFIDVSDRYMNRYPSRRDVKRSTRSLSLPYGVALSPAILPMAARGRNIGAVNAVVSF